MKNYKLFSKIFVCLGLFGALGIGSKVWSQGHSNSSPTNEAEAGEKPEIVSSRYYDQIPLQKVWEEVSDFGPTGKRHTTIVRPRFTFKNEMNIQVPKDSNVLIFFKDGKFIYQPKDKEPPSEPFCEVGVSRQMVCRDPSSECEVYDAVTGKLNKTVSYISKKAESVKIPKELLFAGAGPSITSPLSLGVKDSPWDSLGAGKEKYLQMIKDTNQTLVARLAIPADVSVEGGGEPISGVIKFECLYKSKAPRSSLLQKQGTPAVSDFENALKTVGLIERLEVTKKIIK